MNARISIKRTEDGLVRTYDDELPEPFNEFIWAEGNYACDCNRELFFSRANNEEDDDLEYCTEGRYLVRIQDEHGEMLYDEFDA